MTMRKIIDIASTGTRYTKAPALCLDLDNTIRRSKSGKHFINSADDVELIPGVEPIIKQYKESGYFVLGLTNQGGVAHGYMTPEENGAVQDKTRELFEEDPFDLVLSCTMMPGGEVEPYCHRSLMRKPDIGMLVLFEEIMFRQLKIVDWDNSIMVGDRQEDWGCAQNANIRFEWAYKFFGREK